MFRIVSGMPGSVIVSGARTPIGRLQGSLGDFKAVDLGGVAIEAALARAGIAGDAIDYVIMGQVLQAGAGQITARQAAVKGGIPMTVPALTINKVCLSGLDAIALADQLIAAGEYDVVVAGGMESMSQAPHLLPGSRKGFKFGDTKLVDSMAYDGLFCAFDQVAMGESTEAHNAGLNISRQPPRRTACSTRRSCRSRSRSARATRCCSPQMKGSDPTRRPRASRSCGLPLPRTARSPRARRRRSPMARAPSS
jgi:acetyl-CoA C-acetyltransferase